MLHKFKVRPRSKPAVAADEKLFRFQSRSGRWLVRSLQTKLQTAARGCVGVEARDYRRGGIISRSPMQKRVWHRSIRKLIEREVEDDLARLERLRQEAANDQMQFADPHREARQADDQILDHFRLPQPRSCGLPQGYFASAQRECKTLGLPLAGPLDAILDLFFSLGAELNIAIIDGTSRTRRCLLAAGRLSCRKALGQTVRIAVIASQKSAGSLWQTWKQRTL